jgi:hypothetical protein
VAAESPACIMAQAQQRWQCTAAARPCAVASAHVLRRPGCTLQQWWQLHQCKLRDTTAAVAMQHATAAVASALHWSGCKPMQCSWLVSALSFQAARHSSSGQAACRSRGGKRIALARVHANATFVVGERAAVSRQHATAAVARQRAAAAVARALHWPGCMLHQCSARRW